MYCHKCGTRLSSYNSGNETCTHCGYNPTTTVLNVMLSMQNPQNCNSCRTDNPDHANFCQSCGHQLKKYLRCPSCRSRNISNHTDKSFNWKKAVKGSLVGSIVSGPFAPLGLLAGAYVGGHGGTIAYTIAMIVITNGMNDH